MLKRHYVKNYVLHKKNCELLRISLMVNLSQRIAEAIHALDSLVTEAMPAGFTSNNPYYREGDELSLG